MPQHIFITRTLRIRRDIARLAAVAVAICTAAPAVMAGDQDLYDDTVYRTFEVVFESNNWHRELEETWEGTRDYVMADLIVYDSPNDTTGTTYEDVGVQYKGNSSYWFVNGYKKPYKITMDAFVEDQELYGYDKITLNNGVFDPTKIREVICYKIMNEFMPSPRSNIVFVRSGTLGDMKGLGVYTSVERVNKRFLRKHFPRDDGHRYKAHGGSMTWEGSDPDNYGGYTLSGGDEDTAYQDLIEVCNVLNNTQLSSLRDQMDEIFSIDQLCWQAAAGVALVNWDDLRAFYPHGHNYYLYEDTYNERMHILPWDWDLGLSGGAQEGPYSEFNQAPLTNRLILQTPAVKDRYLAHLRTMASRLDWTAIQPDVQRHRAWSDSRINTVHEQEIFPDASIYGGSHSQLAALIPGRQSYLLNHTLLSRPAPLISNVSHTPAEPLNSETVSVTATVVQEASEGIREVLLYSRDRGRYSRTEMFDDGAHGDGTAGDGVYGTTIQAYAAGETVEYYIEVSSNDTTTGGGTGAKRYEPVYAEHKPFKYAVRAEAFDSPIVINEFMADNDTTIQDPDGGGGYPDWFELHNTGDTDVDLAGYFLTDDLDDTTQFEIPAGVTIPAGGHLLFWADNDEEQGDTHTNFKLSKSGEQLGLFAPIALGNGMADGYTFGEQTADVSEGRSCDGGDEWAFFTTATPGTTNGTCQISCDGDVNGDETVDVNDISYVLFRLGGTPPDGDANGDNVVDVNDISYVLFRLGYICPQS